MNVNKIAFIICVLNENQHKECVSCIKKLEIPAGIEVEIVSIRETKSFAKAYNSGLNQTDAKYKVYLHSNVYVINKNLIKDILDIFDIDNSIGIIGIIGAKRLPANGLLLDDIGKVGEVQISCNGVMEHLKYNNIIEKYEIVEAVDGLIMATQIDIRWKEEIFDGSYFYDISECLEFRKNGLKVVVPHQEKVWCIHDFEDDSINVVQGEIEKYRRVFLKEYPEIQNRNLSSTEDLFDFNRETAMEVLTQNRKGLENYIFWMKNCLILGDYESAARNAYDFAEKVYYYPPGFYVSPEIENMLLVCASKLP